ncbi:unnamed protein product [Rhizopus stolonifer]
MLRPTGNYLDQLNQPDISFDWDTIEQVFVYSNQVKTCCICLSWPTSARVTRCGHIFCLPCILRYLELCSIEKCPMCCEAITKEETRLVRIIPEHGHDLKLVLVQRKSSSTLALPLSDTWPLPEKVISNYIKPEIPLIPWSHTPSVQAFARFMLAHPDDLLAEIEQDLKELDKLQIEEEEEIRFIEQSKVQLRQEKERVRTERTEEMTVALEALDIMFEAVAKYNKRHCESQENAFYFYQAENGQPTFLHPLDIRILKREFGSYYQFPHQLKVKVTSRQECTVDEDLRKKYKYLNHLPLHCDVVFLKIDMKEIVSEETLELFKDK